MRSLALPDHAPSAALPAGTVIAERYAIERRLGEGGMGEVYAAQHVEMERRVAVKLVRPELAGEEANLERFRREARAASRIKSEHVVTVYDFGRDAGTGRLYLAMELLEGETLAAKMERERMIAPEEAVRIATSVTEALDAAHGAKVIHRDLKPENVFLERSGRVKVLDFGIARILDTEGASATAGKNLTSTAMVVGTPAYINPEAAGRKREVVEQSDLYSLGVMLFEMLVGRLPFDDPEPIVLIGLHLRAPPERIGHAAPSFVFPRALEDLVDALLEKDPRDRPASARVVATALAAIGAELAGTMATPAPTAPTAVTTGSVTTSLPPQTATPRAPIAAPNPGAAMPTWVPLVVVGTIAVAVLCMIATWWMLSAPTAPVAVSPVAASSTLEGPVSPVPSSVPPPSPIARAPSATTHLVLAITPLSARPTIAIDGVTIANADTIDLAPGEHRVVVSAPGRQTQSVTITATGERMDVPIALAAASRRASRRARVSHAVAAAAPATHAPAPTAEPSHSGLSGALRPIGPH